LSDGRLWNGLAFRLSLQDRFRSIARSFKQTASFTWTPLLIAWTIAGGAEFGTIAAILSFQTIIALLLAMKSSLTYRLNLEAATIQKNENGQISTSVWG
jgi:hypothetical protein